METLTNKERVLTARSLEKINHLGYAINETTQEIKSLKNLEKNYNSRRKRNHISVRIEFRYNRLSGDGVCIQSMSPELKDLLISLSLKSLNEELETKQKDFDNLLTGIKEDKKESMISRFRKFFI